MTLSDVNLLVKKVLVGVVVTIIPFLIIFGGLWLTRKLLTPGPRVQNLSVNPK